MGIARENRGPDPTPALGGCPEGRELSCSHRTPPCGWGCLWTRWPLHLDGAEPECLEEAGREHSRWVSQMPRWVMGTITSQTGPSGWEQCQNPGPHGPVHHVHPLPMPGLPWPICRWPRELATSCCCHWFQALGTFSPPPCHHHSRFTLTPESSSVHPACVGAGAPWRSSAAGLSLWLSVPSQAERTFAIVTEMETLGGAHIRSDTFRNIHAVVQLLSRVRLWDPRDCSLPGSFVQEFSRQEYWSGLPCHSPGESSRPRDRTHVSHVSYTGRQTLYHCANREAAITCVNLDIYLYMHLAILAHTPLPHQNLFSAPRRSSLLPPVITMVDHPGRAAPPEGPLTAGSWGLHLWGSLASQPTRTRTAQGGGLAPGLLRCPLGEVSSRFQQDLTSCKPQGAQTLKRSPGQRIGAVPPASLDLCPPSPPLLRNSRQVHCFWQNSHLGEELPSSSALSWHDPSLEHLGHPGSQESCCFWMG